MGKFLISEDEKTRILSLHKYAILKENNLINEVTLQDIQNTLKSKGYNVTADNKLGPNTLDAISKAISSLPNNPTQQQGTQSGGKEQGAQSGGKEQGTQSGGKEQEQGAKPEGQKQEVKSTPISGKKFQIKNDYREIDPNTSAVTELAISPTNCEQGPKFLVQGNYKGRPVYLYFDTDPQKSANQFVLTRNDYQQWFMKLENPCDASKLTNKVWAVKLI